MAEDLRNAFEEVFFQYEVDMTWAGARTARTPCLALGCGARTLNPKILLQCGALRARTSLAQPVNLHSAACSKAKKDITKCRLEKAYTASLHCFACLSAPHKSAVRAQSLLADSFSCRWVAGHVHVYGALPNPYNDQIL